MIEVWSMLPDWAQLLVQGLGLGLLMVAGAVAASRAGRSPYWGLCIIIPYLSIAVIWAFAFCEWPTEKGDKKA